MSMIDRWENAVPAEVHISDSEDQERDKEFYIECLADEAHEDFRLSGW